MALAAAAIANVYLVITSDTMLAHLAGVLGRPVWLLASFTTDWRWGYQGNRNVWYPTMRVFCQHRFGHWYSCVQQVTSALTRLVSQQYKVVE